MLLDDGYQKVAEGFVFDMHYVHSLVDDILEAQRDLVLDARVHDPRGTAGLYRRLDAAREMASALLAEPLWEPAEGGAAAEHGAWGRCAEYRLLDRLNRRWIDGAEPGRLCQRDLFWEVVDHGVRAVLAADFATERGRTVRVGDQFVSVVPREDEECRPWACLAAGEGSGVRATEHRPGWIARTGGDRLTLRSVDPSLRVLPEASLQGHQPSDFLFLFCPPVRLPFRPDIDGLQHHRTRLGHAVWLTDASSGALAAALVCLGRAPFTADHHAA